MPFRLMNPRCVYRHNMSSRTRLIVVLAYGFALLGMPGSALGVAWPSMAEDLARSLGDLGILTAVTGAGYAVVSLASGSLTKRIPAGALLVAAAVAAGVSLVIYAGADGWVWFVLASIPLGMAGGAIDAVGNAFVAVNRGAKAMGIIHAAFGFGAMIAPLMITALVALGLSWRSGFGILAGGEFILAVAYLTIASQVRMPMEGRKEKPVRRGRKRLLSLSVWTFFIYTGVEGSTGFWAFTLLVEGQGMDATVAGLAVAMHWGALFVSRLILGVVGDRMPYNATLTVSTGGIVVGLALVWWNPAVWVSIFGLVLAGFASGPIFPLEMLLTPRRFGSEFTPWAVGYQLSAAVAAIAVVPGAIGILVNAYDPLVIGPVLVVTALVMSVSVEVLRIMTSNEVLSTTGA
jgi:fucose permease